MDKSVKETILIALNNYRGDNLLRAKHAWGNLTDDQMDKEHGQSGLTKRELLNSYMKFDNKVKEAIDYVSSIN